MHSKVLLYGLFVFLLTIDSAFAQTELVTNGGFESESTGWVITGNFQADSRFGTSHNGNGYAYLANFDGTSGDNLFGNMYQQVTIPTTATSATLTFWHSISRQDSATIPFDDLNITINNSSGSFLTTVDEFSNVNNTNGSYVQRSFDMTQFIGQTVRINFSGTTDVSFPTTFRIDDVSVIATIPTPSLSFTNLSPTTITTSTAGHKPTLSASGSNFNDVNKITFAWSGPVSGDDTWDKGGTDWNNKVTVLSDNSMTLQPVVTESSDPEGTYIWTVTFEDTSEATASRTFTVSYTPTTTITTTTTTTTVPPATILAFTSLSPTTITTGDVGHQPTLTAIGSNFNNIDKITFAWSGPESGSDTWDKGGTDWNNKVTVLSDNSMTLQPVVTESSDPEGAYTWTVTFEDTSGVTASRTFTRYN